jgi:pyruvate dehydrogenase (quinone)
VGVDRVFGYPGDGINTVLGAIRRAGNSPAFVQARHEENAALMAVGHAKYTGDIGVVLATQGPGAIHLINGVYDAKLDGAPLVAVVAQQERTVLGGPYQQAVDEQTLYTDATQYVQTVLAPGHTLMVVDRAFRSALATRQPCAVILPHDVQQLPVPEPLPQQHGVLVSAPEWRRPRVRPQEDDLRRAAQVLNAGRKVARLVGQGARHASEQVQAVADRLGAGVTTSLLGKPWVDERRPTSAGVMGHLGTSASAFLMTSCDTLLIVGSNSPWTEFYPTPGQVRAVQIDVDTRNLATGTRSTSVCPAMPRRPWTSCCPCSNPGGRTAGGTRWSTRSPAGAPCASGGRHCPRSRSIRSWWCRSSRRGYRPTRRSASTSDR